METAPKKKKALPFKRAAPKPAPRAESSDKDEDDDLDMFRRSKDFFPIAVEEQEERHIKTPPKADRKSSLDLPYEPTGQSPGGEGSAKRRKLSPAVAIDEWDELYDNSEDEAPRSALIKGETLPSTNRIRAGSSALNNGSLTPRPSRLKSEHLSSPIANGALPTPIMSDSKPSTTPDGVISLDDDSDDGMPVTRSRSAQKPRDARPAPSTAMISLDDDDDDLVMIGKDSDEEDDEFAIFIQRAKAREAAMKAATEKTAKSPDSAGADDDADFPTAEHDVQDPVMQIFVTSCLSWNMNIKPLLVHRRISQVMRPVRESWLNIARSRFGLILSPEEEGKIILTWKLNKIYNMTTGLSLNLRPDEDGRVGGYAGPDEGFDRGRLHLEIWHEDELRDFLDEKDRERRKELGEEIDDEDAYEQGDDMDSQEVQQQDKIRVILKGKEMDDVKLTTYADTPVRTLVAAVKVKNGYGSDKTLTIMFDGDPLEEEATMGEVGIEDMDALEVYVK